MLREYSKTYLPVYHWAVEITKEHEDAHWTEKDAKLQEDVEQWATGKITDSEKYFITQILRLFTESDVSVGKSYYDDIIPTFKNNEVRGMLGSFACREATHQRAYALLNDTLGFGESFYAEFLQYKEMADKHEFMEAKETNPAVRLVKQVLTEGVSLFASFAMLLNFDRFGKLKGMSDIVRWSILDESLHIKGNCAIFNELRNEEPELFTGIDDVAKDVAQHLVRLEDAFIDKAFGIHNIKGITPEEVKQYIRYVTDYRLSQLKLQKLYFTANSLEWMNWIVKDAHANFFEREVVSYSKNNLEGEWVYGD